MSDKEIVDTVEVRAYQLNKSAYFILPLLELNVNRDKNFINTYLLSKNHDFDFNTLYLELYNPIDKLERNSNYIGKFDTTDNNVMYIFKIPDFYLSEYELFLSGQYSKFSDKAKMIACKSVAGKDGITNTNIYGILYKTDERRKYIENLVGEKLHADAELCSIPNLEREIYE